MVSNNFVLLLANEKALFRRAKAHIGAWNPELAEKDFNKLKALNPSMAAVVDRELNNMKKSNKKKVQTDKETLKNIFDKENSVKQQ